MYQQNSLTEEEALAQMLEFEDIEANIASSETPIDRLRQDKEARAVVSVSKNQHQNPSQNVAQYNQDNTMVDDETTFDDYEVVD